MGRNALLPILLLLLTVFDGYNVCLGWELRKLLGDNPKGDNKSAIPDTPSPPPIPGDAETDPEHVVETKKKETNSPSSVDAQKGKPEDLNRPISPAPAPSLKTDNTTVNLSGSDNKSPARPPPVPESYNDNRDKKENSKNHEGITFSHSKTNDSCGEGSSPNCEVRGTMFACISQSVSKDLVVLVHNQGDSSIKVKLLIDESNCGDIEMPKSQTDKINISLITSGSNKVTLDAGNGECVLQFVSGTPVTEGNFYLHLPSYDKLLTPVNGAYFLIISIIVFGGTWACCKLGKRKYHDGVPYQELEMALPESVPATDVETAEGWDQGWDDDWNEDMEAKPSVKHHVGSISANGLTSRSSNKDGWEDNWDD